MDHNTTTGSQKGAKWRDGMQKHKQLSYLRPRCSCIEKSGRCMSEPSLRHQVVCLDRRIYVILVNSNSNPHQHVLRSFHNLPLDLQEIGPLKGFETKIIIVKVSIIDYLTVQASSILQPKRKLSKLKNVTSKRIITEKKTLLHVLINITC